MGTDFQHRSINFKSNRALLGRVCRSVGIIDGIFSCRQCKFRNDWTGFKEQKRCADVNIWERFFMAIDEILLDRQALINRLHHSTLSLV